MEHPPDGARILQQGTPHGMKYLCISSGLPTPRAAQYLDIGKTPAFHLTFSTLQTGKLIPF